MKNFITVSATLLLLIFISCSQNDRTGAGQETAGNTGSSSAATSHDYNSPSRPKSDAQASGGATLRASTPYHQANASTVTQDLNPAPFMGGGPVGQSPGSSGVVATNRAMGTVEGPMDQPPAGIGPGMQGQNFSAGVPAPTYSGSGRKSTAGENIPGSQSTQPATPK